MPAGSYALSQLFCARIVTMAVCTMPAQSATSRPPANVGQLSLRVHGTSHDGRLIRIRSAKCTIGSTAGCTLRLRGAGVAPLACWVLRGKGGTVIRRLHGRATLNGGDFQEAPLARGDRLQI